MCHVEYVKHPDIDPLTILPDPLHLDCLLSIKRGTVWRKDMVETHNLVMTYLAERFIVGKSREALEDCMLAKL